jgi:hypothetical protein
VQIPKLHWTIGDLHVDVQDWRANVLAFGGYGEMEGTLPERLVRRHPSVIDQGAQVTAYDTLGATRWQGEIPQPPKFENGLVRIRATGPIEEARRMRQACLEQTMEYGFWIPQDSDPHNYENNEPFGVDVQGGRIMFTLEGSQSINQNDRAGVLAWLKTQITRMAFTVDKGTLVDNTGYIFRIRTAVGPNGTRTQRGADIAGTAPFTVDINTGSGDDDLIIIEVVREGTGGTTPATPVPWRVVDLRVNGRASGDSMLTSEIAADLGGLLGFDTSGVQSTALNGLPFFLDASASWTDDGLFYLAAITDWRCLVLEDLGAGPLLDFGPWERTWTVLRQSNAAPDLDPLPVYNRVVVNYSNPSGRWSQVIVDADPDPLVGTPLAGRKVEWREDLADVQTDDNLATAVANYLLPIVSTPRDSGRIEIVGARADDGTGHVYSPRGGDLVTEADYGQAESRTRRVWEVEYRPDGATLGIEAPVSSAGFVAWQSLRRARQQRQSRVRVRRV